MNTLATVAADPADAPALNRSDLLLSPPDPLPQDVGPLDGIREQLQNTIGDAMFRPPATPADYYFEPVHNTAMHDPALESATRAMLHKEGFPAGIGAQLVREWNRAAAIADQIPPTRHALDSVRAEQTMRTQWGNQFDANLELVQAEIARIAREYPELPLRDMLASTPLGNSTWLAETVLNRAHARRARAGA